MKTIKEAAESAAKELIEDGIGYSFIGFDGLSFHGASPERLTNVIARHFADFAALRDAAERALEIGQCVQGDYNPGPIPGPEPTERDYLYGDFDEALTALRGLLNTQPTKET